MSTPDLATLRDALTAARPALTGEQQDAADALLEALTPPMEEPTWPGAPVIAACHPSVNPSLHTRCNSSSSRWECKFRCTSTPWGNLIKPRPLTAEEYAEHRIPMPAEPITDDLVWERAQREKIFASLTERGAE